MPRLRWFTWVGLMAAGVAAWSLVWLGISSYVVQTVSRIETISAAGSPSIGSQILTLVFAAFLATEATRWLRRH